jgi:hypothetical protein
MAAHPGLVVLLLALCWTGPGAAAPRVPVDDAEVIERLPAGTARRLAPPAAMRGADPLAAALARADEALAQGRRSGDPRDWGLAQASLAPWWSLDAPPPAVRWRRALIRQHQHAFAAALADLDVLRQGTGGAPLALRAQAELTRAGLLQVQGDYAAARAGCERLAGADFVRLGAAVAVPAQACLIELDQLQGRRSALQADAALAALGPADEPWLALLRAEMAQRAGRPEAGALFALATAARLPSHYALAAHADWLLEQGRAQAVLALLARHEAVDALLLRAAIARRLLSGGPAAAPDLAELQARFGASRARGDEGHAREQARFALELLDDAPQALALAQANWAHQREPADAWLLVRAAQAAGRPDAAAPVHAWARAQGFSDMRWRALARTGGGRRT